MMHHKTGDKVPPYCNGGGVSRESYSKPRAILPKLPHLFAYHPLQILRQSGEGIACILKPFAQYRESQLLHIIIFKVCGPLRIGSHCREQQKKSNGFPANNSNVKMKSCHNIFY